MAYAFDTLSYAKRLRDTGISQGKPKRMPRQRGSS